MRRDPFKLLMPLFAILAALPGCGSPDAQFGLNMVYLRRQEKMAEDFDPLQKQDVADILTAMFGTPNDPHVPADAGMEAVVDLNRLRMAAGPVWSDQEGRAQGLYRQHCAHCHGITGDGLGPTAPFLNPYPRDYRRGTFKFKSTPKGVRPTHDDLKRILRNGVPGTSMPSFKLLPDGELEALVDYVKYLAIRGEVERALVEEIAVELDSGERLDTGSDFLVDMLLADAVARWADAPSLVTPVPARPDWKGEEELASIRRGRELFHGEIANCVSCHGETGLGDGQRNNFDDWTVDFIGQESEPEELDRLQAEILAYGGLSPRNILPRNLRRGVYRGGRRPVDIYWRIKNGIDGGPMPAASMKPEGGPPDALGLSSNDIWHLVDYIMSLPYEQVGKPIIEQHDDVPTYQRERL